MAEKTSDPRLIDWMICDDIRVENTGKLFFIGVYLNNIVVNTIPKILPRLVIYSKWNSTGTPIEKFKFKLTRPSGAVQAKISGKLSPPEKFAQRERNFQIIQINISPFKVEEAGEYCLEIIFDRETIQMGSFHISLQQPRPVLH